MLPMPRVKSTSKWRMCLLVSSNCTSTWIVFADARMAANQNGVAALNHDTIDGSASTPPRNGPMMKPTPNAAPIMPKFFVRSCGDVTSAMEACATDRLPPVMPSSARATEQQRDVAEDDADREERVAERRAGERQREHGLPAVAIRQLAENRRREELHDRKHGHEKAEHDVAGARRGVLAEQVMRRRRVSRAAAAGSARESRCPACR